MDYSLFVELWIKRLSTHGSPWIYSQFDLMKYMKIKETINAG